LILRIHTGRISGSLQRHREGGESGKEIGFLCEHGRAFRESSPKNNAQNEIPLHGIITARKGLMRLPARLVLGITGDVLRENGFHSLEDLEFSLFGKNWIGDKLGVRGGKKLAVQDQYLDFKERLDRLSPMTKTIVRELFHLREPGMKLCLVMMGFLGEEHLPKGRGKKVAREDLETLMKKAVDPFIPLPK
jgi:hypothetical protein